MLLNSFFAKKAVFGIAMRRFESSHPSQSRSYPSHFSVLSWFKRSDSSGDTLWWYTQMRRQTYLLRSRHGVYYFRMVIPQAIRSSLGFSGREVRLSLGTKDRQAATRQLPSRIFAMTNLFKDLQPWEVDAQERLAKYKRGLALIKSYGNRG